MASDPQGKFRSLEPPGMVTLMRKMDRSGVIFVITYYGHTQYSTPVMCSENPAKAGKKCQIVGSGPGIFLRFGVKNTSRFAIFKGILG